MMSNSEARKRLAANEPTADVEALADVIGSEIAPIGGWLSLTRAAEAVIASDWLAAHTAAAEARGAERALLEAAEEMDRQRADFAAEDEAEGCTSRFCGGWINGVLFTAMHLRNLAHRKPATS